jgi:hypothetical protein
MSHTIGGRSVPWMITGDMLPFVDALQSSGGHSVPVHGIFVAFLEEVGNLVACLFAIKGVDMET